MGLLDWLSFGLDVIPFVGETKAVLELISGKDLVTKEELDLFDRATCAISLLPVAGWVTKLSKSSKAVKHAKKFEKFFYLVEKANKANDYVDKFNGIRLTLDEFGYNTTNIKLDPKIINLIEEKKQQLQNERNQQVIQMIRRRNFKKSVSEIATEVIRGNWGNGEERKRRLEEAGYNYHQVQDEVNRQLRK